MTVLDIIDWEANIRFRHVASPYELRSHSSSRVGLDGDFVLGLEGGQKIFNLEDRSKKMRVQVYVYYTNSNKVFLMYEQI